MELLVGHGCWKGPGWPGGTLIQQHWGRNGWKWLWWPRNGWWSDDAILWFGSKPTWLEDGSLPREEYITGVQSQKAPLNNTESLNSPHVHTNTLRIENPAKWPCQGIRLTEVPYGLEKKGASHGKWPALQYITQTRYIRDQWIVKMVCRRSIFDEFKQTFLQMHAMSFYWGFCHFHDIDICSTKVTFVGSWHWDVSICKFGFVKQASSKYPANSPSNGMRSDAISIHQLRLGPVMW